ncbi:hypothetical protein [Prescottella subtropica]|uniref:hypothetical protein n=1 Tax=Prescottella subtropica TaxID=2545757 RepID=UPI0010FA53A4|nr:hypothetical protein [Prescottella subtropica]
MTALAGERGTAALEPDGWRWPDGTTMRLSTDLPGGSDSFLFFTELVVRTEVADGPKRMLIDTISGQVDGVVTAVTSGPAGISVHFEGGSTVRLVDVVAVTF